MNIPQLTRSILDNDLYKATMQQAAISQYDGLEVEYELTMRKKRDLPQGFIRELRRQIKLMANLAMTDEEYTWMKTSPSLSFLKRSYIDFLRGYRYNPAEVTVQERKSKIKLKIKGPWYRTILWEVPLLALKSELYFVMKGEKPNMELFWRKLEEKNRMLVAAGCMFTDFGTRRRFSFDIHDKVVEYFAKNAPKNFMGTSNMYLAMKHGVRPIGTHAHEWFMAHAAMFGTRSANKMGLDAWMKEYGGRLGHALTDTFTTDAFLETFDYLFARQFDGVRQDSGDPFAFGEKIIAHYRSLNIDPASKMIIFSDSLDAEKAVALQKAFGGRIKVAFGIGTNFTNDVGVEPLNMVIKLRYCWIHGRRVEVVKLSDDVGKHHGSKTAVRHTQYEIGIN